MINKILYRVLVLLLCGMTFPIGAQNIIVLKNNPVDVSGMERITFDNSVTPPLLIGHTVDSNITVPFLDKTAIPFFSGLDLNGSIYEAPLTGQAWTHYYLTPIGYFYLAPVNALLDEEEQMADDTRQVWLYQSFDTLEWAFITTDQSLLSTENIEYTNGDFSINYIPDAVETYHIVGDGNLLEKSIPYNADQINPDAYSNKLLKMIYGLTQTLAGYTPEAEEAQFAGLIEKFKSLLGMSVAQTTATNTFATSAAQKLAKKKIKDRNFTIYPVTGSVNEIFDGYVGKVEGRLNCASQDFKKNSEYGIVYATTPENCVVGKGTCVKARQEDLKLTFVAELENLKPGSTYYYRTYAKINPADKNKFSFKYEYAGASTGYGKIKKFTTAKYCHPKVTYWMLDNPCWDYKTTDTEICENFKVSRTSVNSFRYLGDNGNNNIFGIYEEHECNINIDCCDQTFKLDRSYTYEELNYNLPSGKSHNYSFMSISPKNDFKEIEFQCIICVYGCYAATTSVFTHTYGEIPQSRFKWGCVSESISPMSCSKGYKRYYGWHYYPYVRIPFNINEKFEYISEENITCNEYMRYITHTINQLQYQPGHYTLTAGGLLHTEESCENSGKTSNLEKHEFKLHMQFLIELVPIF